jgi:hypothetical protein
MLLDENRQLVTLHRPTAGQFGLDPPAAEFGSNGDPGSASQRQRSHNCATGIGMGI